MPVTKNKARLLRTKAAILGGLGIGIQNKPETYSCIIQYIDSTKNRYELDAPEQVVDAMRSWVKSTINIPSDWMCLHTNFEIISIPADHDYTGTQVFRLRCLGLVYNKKPGIPNGTWNVSRPPFHTFIDMGAL